VTKRRGGFRPLLSVRAGAGYRHHPKAQPHWTMRALHTRTAIVLLVTALTALLGVALLLI